MKRVSREGIENHSITPKLQSKKKKPWFPINPPCTMLRKSAVMTMLTAIMMDDINAPET